MIGFAIILVIVVGVVVASRSSGSKGGTCPSTDSQDWKDLLACWREKTRNTPGFATVICGRMVVSARTGNNEHYKEGDRLDQCLVCSKLVENGLYPEKGGLERCVEQDERERERTRARIRSERP